MIIYCIKYLGFFVSKEYKHFKLIFHRVVISSGNLTIGDWTIWSNCVWFKDFPKKSTMTKVPEKEKVPAGSFDFTGDFIEGLKTFVQSLMPLKANYKNMLEINIDDYYISDIDIALIPSIPGRHADGDLDICGHRRVASVLKQIGFPDQEALMKKKYVLTYQTSSIGNLDEKYLKEVLSSFLPNYLTIDDLKADKKPKGKKAAITNFTEKTFSKSLSLSNELASDRVRLIFPAKDYVETCNDPDYAGCLILNPQSYERATFPKDIFHQFQCPEDYAFHEGIIPHLKVFIVAPEDGEIDDNSYIYFGSHNFSPSAWGRFEKEYTQLSISNSELGVLIPPGKGKSINKWLLIWIFRNESKETGNFKKFVI